MFSLRRTAALCATAVFLALLLVGCTVNMPGSQVTAPAPTAAASTSTAPTPTADPSSTAPTDDQPSPDASPSTPPKPKKPKDFITLSGTILAVNRADSDGGEKCHRRVLDIVVDTRDDAVRGIKFVQFHDPDGIRMDAKYIEIGDQLDIKVTRDNFKPLLLERGEEPFPPQDELTACDDAANPEGSEGYDVFEPFYGTWGIVLPWDGETMTSKEALKDNEKKENQ